MTTLTEELTLGELVTTYPLLASELERRQLDYCCGGRRALGDACRSAGLDAAEVIRALSAKISGPAPAPWASMDAAELTDHLEATHHRYLKEAMPALQARLDKLVRVHGGRHPELVEIRQCLAALVDDLEPHLMKEERVLFPMIRELGRSDRVPAFPCGSLKNPISVMLMEHDRVGELLARLRALTSGYTPPADRCGTYVASFAGLEELEADTHLHVHKENNLLFPAVLRLEQRLATASKTGPEGKKLDPEPG